MGALLKLEFVETVSLGMSKLEVFVTLKTSNVYFSENRSVTGKTLTNEMLTSF